MKKYIGYCFILLALACKTETKPMEENDNKQSVEASNQDVSVAKESDQLKQVLLSKGFTIMADIDHAAGAEKVGLDLRPTRTLIFGNPKGGTVLMQQAQEIGIDLPLKVAVWEDDQGAVHSSYYNASALTKRYGIVQPEAVIAKIDGMFTGVTGSAGRALEQKEGNIIQKLIVKKSPLNVEETFVKLKEIVAAKGLQIMAEVPHDKGAAKVGLPLRPTRVLIFGNPKVGTLLMQSNQEIALDLPLKIMVYENEAGATLVSYYDASFLTTRYGITDKEMVVQKVNAALDGITTAVVAQ